MNDLKPFSETITTGSEVPTSPVLHAEPEEVTLQLGSQEWQKLLEQIGEWKKRGGTLNAVLRDKRNQKIKLKVSDIKTDAKTKRDWNQASRESRVFHALADQADLSSNERDKLLWMIPVTVSNMKRLQQVILDKYRGLDLTEAQTKADAYRKSILGEISKSVKNLIPQGNYYHPKVGWY